MLFPNQTKLAAVVAAAFLLTACAGTGGSGSTAGDTTRGAPGASNAALNKAQALEQKGEFANASVLYEQTASQLPYPRSEIWRAKAAETAWKGGQLDRAEQLVKNTDGSALSRNDRALSGILAARIARQKGDYPRVITALDFPRDTLARPMQSQILALLYQAYAATANKQGMAQVLIDRLNIARSLNDSEQLWNLLSNMTPEELARWKAQPVSPTTRGWIELAAISQDAYDKTRLDAALQRWDQTYRNHPASAERVKAIRAERTEVAINTNRIGVLLPMTGPLAGVSRVILDGIMAAQLSSGSTSKVEVYDTQDTPSLALQKYNQAVSEGAGLIIGPLNKDGVDALAEQSLSVPAITLNYGRNPTLNNPNLFQFALLPEDEAQQAAEKMSLDGYQKVAVFVPKNEWGQRIADAFGQRTRELGGSIVGVGGFDPNKSDASPVIRRVLGISGARRNADVDAIFIAATPNQARMLKPLFKFHYAGDLPVYATSHLWSGNRDSAADRDLDGIRFTEIPWLIGITPSDAQQAPTVGELDGTSASLPRLFAFGYDAISLAPKVRQLAASPAVRHGGLSGDIYADGTNRLHRATAWARFSNGSPRILEESAER